MNQKKILVVTQYIYPENFKSNELVFEMAKRGYHVDVLTGIPNYPEGVYFKGYGLFKKRIEKKRWSKLLSLLAISSWKKGFRTRSGLKLYYICNFCYFLDFLLFLMEKEI